MKGKILYYVEGETEEKLINTLKNDLLISGKVEKLNLWEKEINSPRLRTITANNIIVILDTDVHNHTSVRFENLTRNLERLIKGRNKIIIITQNRNLEDELVNSTNINKIKEFYKVESEKEHKHRFIDDKSLLKNLKQKEFNIDFIWNSVLLSEYINHKIIEHGKEKIIK